MNKQHTTPERAAELFLAGVRACPEILHAGCPDIRRPTTHLIGASDRANAIFEELKGALLRYRDVTGFGRGLAAPQIGIRERAFVTYLGDEWKLFLNPSIVGAGSSSAESLYRESCLSCGPISVDVRRRARITATWTTASGKIEIEELAGAEARIFQHELDHLDGVLCVDIAEPGSINLRTEDPLAEMFRPVP